MSYNWNKCHLALASVNSLKSFRMKRPFISFAREQMTKILMKNREARKKMEEDERKNSIQKGYLTSEPLRKRIKKSF
jgi:hypothetical protein